jgi:hypothetical protein
VLALGRRGYYDVTMSLDLQKNTYRLGGLVIVVAAIFFIYRDVEAPEKTPVANTSATGQGQGLPAGLPQIDPASIGKIVKDPKTGQEFMSNQIIVEFVAGTSEEEMVKSLDAAGAIPLSRFTASPVFLVIVDDIDGDGNKTRDAVAVLKKDPKVKNAELNFLTTIENDQPAAP